MSIALRGFPSKKSARNVCLPIVFPLGVCFPEVNCSHFVFTSEIFHTTSETCVLCSRLSLGRWNPSSRLPTCRIHTWCPLRFVHDCCEHRSEDSNHHSLCWPFRGVQVTRKTKGVHRTRPCAPSPLVRRLKCLLCLFVRSSWCDGSVEFGESTPITHLLHD